MWMSELSHRSGVPVATVKFYLREGLLHPGEARGATRAVYDDSHLERLRLVRALVDVGGMGLDRVRDVLAEVDRDSPLHEVLASAHQHLSPAPAVPPTTEARTRVADLIRERRWRCDPAGRHATALAAALDAMAAAGLPASDDALATYAEAAGLVARAEVARLPASRAGSATYAVTGTVLAEPVLLALRRMAHEDQSQRRFRRRRRAGS